MDPNGQNVRQGAPRPSTSCVIRMMIEPEESMYFHRTIIPGYTAVGDLSRRLCVRLSFLPCNRSVPHDVTGQATLLGAVRDVRVGLRQKELSRTCSISIALPAAQPQTTRRWAWCRQLLAVSSGTSGECHSPRTKGSPTPMLPLAHTWSHCTTQSLLPHLTCVRLCWQVFNRLDLHAGASPNKPDTACCRYPTPTPPLPHPNFWFARHLSCVPSQLKIPLPQFPHTRLPTHPSTHFGVHASPHTASPPTHLPPFFFLPPPTNPRPPAEPRPVHHATWTPHCQEAKDSHRQAEFQAASGEAKVGTLCQCLGTCSPGER